MNLRDQSRQPFALHLLLIVGLSCIFESLFIYYGLNPIDESWPINTIRNMDAGRALYQEVLWVFPPGHLSGAWLGYHLSPPGYLVSRVFNAGFAVLLCVGLYFLGRRIMPARFALLAALLTAVAAPDSHLMHNLFGYRYMIFSVLALIAFARRIETDDIRWLTLAGLLLGFGAAFRLGPVFAAGCGLGVAIMAMHRDPRQWLRDWGALGLGVLVVFVPLLGWAALTVGIDVIWRELVSRPALMLELQSLPFPALDFPDFGDRVKIRQWFVSLQFRIIWVLYIGYLAALAYHFIRAWRADRAFAHPLLVAVWLWGGIFFVRSLTRSDEAHLDSVIPPVLLLAAHGLYSVVGRINCVRSQRDERRAWVEGGVIASALAVWVMLLGTDMYFPYARRGGVPIQSLGGRIEVSETKQAKLTDLVVRRLKLTSPDAKILDLTASPVYLLLADRQGYLGYDLVMPGTFITDAEEQGFLAQIQRDPPDLVIWSKPPFDRDPAKSMHITAPKITAWILARYQMWGLERRHYLMGPKGSKPPKGW